MPRPPPESESSASKIFRHSGTAVAFKTTFELAGVGDPAHVTASRLSAGVLPTLGIAPLMGRFFTEQEDQGLQHLAILSYSLWQSRFHGDAQVLGQKILLDRQPYVVIGVMPRNFEFPLFPGHLSHSQLWVPVNFAPSELTPSGNWGFQIVGRLRPGVTSVQAQDDANQVARETMRNFPPFLAAIKINAVVRPLQEDTVGEARPLVRILFLAVCVVLLIACANLAGLLLVRAIRRRREISVRLALGATSAALLRQSILESLALSVTGGILGIGFAAVAIRLSVNQLPENLPRISEIGLDWTVVTFAMFLAVGTGMLCSIAPAFAAIRTDLNEGLKEGGRGGTAGGSHARLRSALVVVEIGIAMVLVVASGLLLRSFEKMREVTIGFRANHVLVASYSLPHQQYNSQAAVNRFNYELLRRLKALPGSEHVGLTSNIPMSGAGGTSVFIPEGYVAPQGANLNLAATTVTSGDYFDVMRIPLLHGRTFTEADNEGAPLVAIVNHKLAQYYWPGQDPLGKRLRIGTPETKTPWVTIVGEVADVKQDSPDIDTQEQYYEPVEQLETSLGQLATADDVRGATGYIAALSKLPPEQMENDLRSTVRSLDPQLALDQMQTMEQAVSDTEAQRRFNTAVISAFAGAPVLLAVLGIYSVIAFSVQLRTREIAIRMALGSQRQGVIRLILRSAVRLAVLGCVVGALGSLFASRLMSALIFQVKPFDPLVLAFAAVVLLFFVMAASLLPTMQAASVDPIETLRAE